MADKVLQNQRLWEEYQRNRTNEVRGSLVTQYLDLVRYVVSRVGRPSYVTGKVLDQGDMVQFGVMGLMEAIDRYAPGLGVKFETYAIPRIRGAILDELRNLDWVPRSVRANARRVDNAVDRVSQEVGREAAEQEIADKLAMSVKDLQKILTDAGRGMTPQRNENDGEDGDCSNAVPEDSPNAFEQLTDDECKGMLVEAVGGLPERERTVIALYYYEGLKFGDIARILKVSESRVSQIHTEVLSVLRKQLIGLV